MTRKNMLFPVLVAMAMLGISTSAYAKNGADDATGGVDAQPHKVLRQGADDATGGVDAQPHKLSRKEDTSGEGTGHLLAKNGADDATGGVDAQPHKIA